MGSQAGSKTSSYGSANLILPLLEHLDKTGVDRATVLDRAGIAESELVGTKTLFPKQKFETLWQVAAEATGDPAIALRVSTMVKTDTLGIIGHLALASESRRKAFELVKDLIPLLWDDVECELDTDGEVALLRLDYHRDPYASRFTTEYAIGLTIRSSRVLGTGNFEPLEARFSYPAPDYADEYERILEIPVRFDASENGILFPLSTMDTLNPAADAVLRQLLERYAAEQLAKMPTSARFSKRVRSCIRSMLPLGSLTADTVAAQFRMSERTLRKRLQEEATSYQEILDDVRAQLARHYLTKEKRGIGEVGFLLGFSDQSAFTKAFRRWTGQTPADFIRTSSS